MDLSHKLQLGIIVALFSLIVFGFVALHFMKSDGFRCLSNPFTYSAEYAKENTGLDLSCSCSFNDIRYVPFTYDINGTHVENQGIGNARTSHSPINLSELNITFIK